VAVADGEAVADAEAVALGEGVPAVAERVPLCDGVAPTPAEQLAKTKTASMPATTRPVAPWRGTRRKWMGVRVVAPSERIAIE
jgi:hypothetical protein